MRTPLFFEFISRRVCCGVSGERKAWTEFESEHFRRLNFVPIFFCFRDDLPDVITRIWRNALGGGAGGGKVCEIVPVLAKVVVEALCFCSLCEYIRAWLLFVSITIFLDACDPTD